MPTVSQTDPFLWHLAPLGVTHDPGSEVDGAVPPDQTEYDTELAALPTGRSNHGAELKYVSNAANT